MLRAFLDAGKTFPGLALYPAITVAGFVADLDRWAVFQSKWAKERKRLGIEYFHMVDYEAKKKVPYRDWSNRKHANVLKKLVQITLENVSFGVAATIPKITYDSVESR